MGAAGVHSLSKIKPKAALQTLGKYAPIGKDSNSMYKNMVGGENAKNKPGKLDEAKELLNKGVDRKKIEDKTGWRYNLNENAWKFDFDKDAKWATKVSELLSKHSLRKNLLNVKNKDEFLLKQLAPNAKELYKQYPHLKDLKIKFYNERAEVNNFLSKMPLNGHYDENTNTIYFSAGNQKPSTVAHEVQHAIQAKENRSLDTDTGIYSEPMQFKHPDGSITKVEGKYLDDKYLKYKIEKSLDNPTIFKHLQQAAGIHNNKKQSVDFYIKNISPERLNYILRDTEYEANYAGAQAVGENITKLEYIGNHKPLSKDYAKRIKDEYEHGIISKDEMTRLLKRTKWNYK